MLQQYQQQPDYTPYGTGIGYGAQPSSAGYFNYAASESSWYGSPSPADVQHSGLSQNACNTHVGDSAGNFLNHGYHQTSTTGTAASSAESFASNNHPVSQDNMDPMADFLGGHQNMNENDKIKEESIDWLSTIINDEVADRGNRQDGGGGGACDGGGDGSKLLAANADLPSRKSHEPNGRLPNFHQAFGSTEIGRFSQHEYYEPPKDGECLQSAGGHGPGASGAGAAQQEEHPPAAVFEPPRQQNRRGRTPRGGGQHRRTKQSRTAAAAAAAAAAAVHQYVNYDVTGSPSVGGSGRHQMPPYHHQDPYARHQHVQQRYHHQQDYHHHQPSPTPSSYQSHQHEQYYRPYDRMHYQQQHQHQQHQQQQQLQQHQQQQPVPPMNQYYGGNREQSAYAAGGYNRFHSCCSTEHIARPSHHHNYGPGQYYGDYNAYSQW